MICAVWLHSFFDHKCVLLTAGAQYAKALGEYATKEFANKPDLKVWTSLMKRTMQTAAYINAPKEHWKPLDEIDAVCNASAQH
jgi:broad specificity phosphatase PhoE